VNTLNMNEQRERLERIERFRTLEH